jgi:hypothetical protein
MKKLADVADRSYKTYRARLKAFERLQSRQRAWNTSLLALSVATTIASIALLSDENMYGKAGPTVLVCVSVLALVASLAVAGLNYGVRSRDMFRNYRAIQRISVEAEGFIADGEASSEDFQKLADRYHALLDDSENQTSADHKAADKEADIKRWHVAASATLTVLPYVALIVPILVVVPFIAWALRGGQ